MKLTWDEIQTNAIKFSKRWEKAWDEKSEAQSFVRDFLAVFGVGDAAAVGRFEERAVRENGRTGFMDYFWKNRIAVEMKTKGKNLDDAYIQLRDYVFHKPADEIPELLLVSDFENIVLYRRTAGIKEHFKTKDLKKKIKLFGEIAGYGVQRTFENQLEVNIKAAEQMARLHDLLKDCGYDGHNLEVYLVRLLFCLFADDTGIFPKDALANYIENSKPHELAGRIQQLFDILNMAPETRAKRTLLTDELKQFQYINGGLFKETLPMPELDARMILLLRGCMNFDWSNISPAIFGAMFQGVMDKNQRRELGAHYTSEENILKLINPLFLDDLWKEFEKVKADPKALNALHEKIAKMKFLDPACGCGNFLVITYRELRKLELAILKLKIDNSSQLRLDISLELKVGVEQFYGIEYEEFPCQIAQVAMWLIDHQMNLRVSEQFGMYYARLPLTRSATIVHGNALRINWEEVVPKSELSFILGNPPFVGARLMSQEQKSDMLLTFGKNYNGVGNLDYVTVWYKKSADLIKNTNIKCAFVSTNSIIQGQQYALLFKPLQDNGVAHTVLENTFKWSNEAKGKAAVFCIIVKIENNQKQMQNFVEPISKPICNVPKLTYGSFALDDGHFTISSKEYKEILYTDKSAAQFLRPFIGARELLHNEERYCVWLQGANPTEIKTSPTIMQKIQAVKTWRSQSERQNTKALADTPMLFAEIRQPNTNYLAIPTVSSERRNYIPIAFLPPKVIASNQIYVLPNATLYHFGILTSNVHNSWMRAVAGRLKSDYRYSNNIVYNNFVWPQITDQQAVDIERLAQAVLDARATFPTSSLADLYDPLTMPQDLLKAHKDLDRAVMKLYGFSNTMTEPEIVAKLMERILI